MWLQLLILAVIVTSIVLLSLTIHKMNGKSKNNPSVYNLRLCGDKYVKAQNRCLKGKPWVTAGCHSHNAWAVKAQKCIDNVDKECQSNCRASDCPGWLDTQYQEWC